ncbi:hypothetical protein BG004_001816 [Podila humilis]|nr:hypothetical protein BG004_001816 [Podila humilis]
MSSTMSLVRRGSYTCSASKSTATRSVHQTCLRHNSITLSSEKTPRSRVPESGTTPRRNIFSAPLMNSRITRHWIQSLNRITLNPQTNRLAPETRLMMRFSISASLRSNRQVSRLRDTIRKKNMGSTSISSERTGTKGKPLAGSDQQNPTRSNWTTTQHAPLFTRNGNSPRVAFGKDRSMSRPPEYLIRSSQEESIQLPSHQFDPFIKHMETREARYHDPVTSFLWHQGLGKGEPSTHSYFWAINPLPVTSQRRTDLKRTDVRPDAKTALPAIETIDDILAPIETTAPSIRPSKDLPSVEKKEQIVGMDTSAGSYGWQGEPVTLAGPAIAKVRELLEQIATPGRIMPRHEFEQELYKIGESLLCELGLTTIFLQHLDNREDIIATGLDLTITTMRKEPDRTLRTRNAETMLRLLIRHDHLRLVDRVNLKRLRIVLAAPLRDDTRDWTPPEKQKASLERALNDAMAVKMANCFGRDEWKVQTRRFRLALALARETGRSPSDQEYTRFMRICGKSSQFQELELAFHHFLDIGGSPSESMFHQYIKGLIRQGRLDHAQEVFNSMKRAGVKPKEATYGALIEGYGREQDFEKVKGILRSMVSAGQTPSLVIYTSLISNYLRADQLGMASQVCHELLEQNIELDVQSQNVIANVMRRQRGDDNPKKVSSPKPTSIVAAVTQEVTDAASELSDAIIKDNAVIAVNHNLQLVADSLDTVRFAKTFRELATQGLRPNTITFNILLNVLNRTGELEDGLKVLEYMKSTQDAQPDVFTFSTLMHGAVEHRKVDLGWSLYDEMMRRSLKPTLVTYSTLIELVGLDPTNKFGRGTVRQHLLPSSRSPTRFSVKAQIEDQVGLNFAAQLYNQLCSQGLHPNEHIFGALLNLAIQGGYIGLAQPIYVEMIRQNVQPNTAIMTLLIKGFEIQRDFESGWRVWRNMVETGIPRNVITYHHLIRLCERSFPNPTMLAEYLESGVLPMGETIAQPNETKTKKRTSKKKEGVDIESASVCSENTNRIPLAIWTELRNQMVVDKVHWQRINQFRRKTVDQRIWQPIPRDAGPVSNASLMVAEKDEIKKELSGESSMASFDDYLGQHQKRKETTDTDTVALVVNIGGEDGQELQQEQEHEHEHTQRVSTLIRGEFSNNVQPKIDERVLSATIQEIYTGGGDRFTLKRGVGAPFRLQWDAKALTPMVKKDADAHEQAGASKKAAAREESEPSVKTQPKAKRGKSITRISTTACYTFSRQWLSMKVIRNPFV